MIDDLPLLKKIDKSNMLDEVAKFPKQLEEAALQAEEANLEIAEQTFAFTGSYTPDNIFILGMGGSAISGDILAAWKQSSLSIPIYVIRDYSLPKYLGENSLVFAISYSGNTEETIATFEEARQRGARMFSITSGGLLEKLSLQYTIPVIKVPGGIQPRAALAYLFMSLIVALERLSIIRKERGFMKDIERLQKEFDPNTLLAKNRAKQTALKIRDRETFIYSYAPYGPVVTRWRTQLNENAKIIAHSNLFPELNHNEIVGWDKGYDTGFGAVVLIRDSIADEDERMRKRIEITEDIAFAKRARTVDIRLPTGASVLSCILGGIFLGDYVSIYLACMRQIDPAPVKIIEHLKEKMAE